MAITIPAQRLPTVEPSLAGLGQVGVEQNIRANPDAFGADIAKAYGEAGRQTEQGADRLARQAVAMQVDQNETIAKDADIDFQTKLIKLQFDPQTGFQTLQGKAAVDAYPKIYQAVKDEYTNARAALPNDSVRKMFDQVAVRRSLYAMESMASHTAQQNKQWQVNTATSWIQNQIDASAAYWNDDVKFQQTLGSVQAGARQLGDLKGADEESIKALTTHYTSAAWMARLRAVSATDAATAREMFDANKGQIDAAHAAQIDQTIQHREDVQARAAEVEQLRRERAAERGERKAQEQAADSIAQRIFAPDSKITPQDINTAPGLRYQDRLHLMNVLKAQAKDDVKTDRATVQNDLNRRIDLPWGDPEKITDSRAISQARIDGDISDPAADRMLKRLSEARTADGEKLSQTRGNFMHGMKKLIETPELMGSGADELGAKRFSEFDFYVNREIERFKRANKDPYSLFDPASADYLGKPETISRFQHNLQEKMQFQNELRNAREQGAAGAAPGGEAPAKPTRSLLDIAKDVFK